uniref:Uncharacterized protein n=1 Tax=Arion vulgaris TaxID=1028688 RepID=A0A0B7BLK1_9EUPU
MTLHRAVLWNVKESFRELTSDKIYRRRIKVQVSLPGTGFQKCKFLFSQRSQQTAFQSVYQHLLPIYFSTSFFLPAYLHFTGFLISRVMLCDGHHST